MPQAFPLRLDFEAELERWHKQRVKDRTHGRHLSEIIHRIIKKLDPKRFGSPYEPTIGHMGFVWEDVVSYVLSRQLGGDVRGKPQIELERDGIFMTMDWFNTRTWRVREYKATKMSGATDIRSNKFRHWHYQLMAYCLEMDTDEAELVPLFINGSYELAGGRFGKTVAIPYVIRYTAMEKRENWEMILRERDRMDREERGRGSRDES